MSNGEHRRPDGVGATIPIVPGELVMYMSMHRVVVSVSVHLHKSLHEMIMC